MACGGHTVVCKKLFVFVRMTLIAPRPAAITLPSVTLIVPRPSANRAQQGLGSCACTFLGATRAPNNNAKASSTVWRRLHRHILAPPAFAPLIHLLNRSRIFPLSPVLENVSHVRLQLSCVGGIAFSDGVVVCDACRFLPQHGC